MLHATLLRATEHMTVRKFVRTHTIAYTYASTATHTYTVTYPYIWWWHTHAVIAVPLFAMLIMQDKVADYEQRLAAAELLIAARSADADAAKVRFRITDCYTYQHVRFPLIACACVPRDACA